MFGQRLQPEKHALGTRGRRKVARPTVVAGSTLLRQDGPMAGPHRRLRPVLGLVAALVISVGWAATPAPADAALPAWKGSINLYRTGVFSTQKSWLWCTAAGVQIMRNIKYHREDHSRTTQSRYFEYMRTKNRYNLPRSAGVDPQGWTAGLRRYVDDRYRLVASDTFTTGLRLAVKRIRLTNLPVALTVSHGNHGWVLHGFTATADPSKTNAFTVTSVRVSGPLWGLQNSTFGYDMRPNTKLSATQLKRFFTKWWYAPKRMIWDNTFVSIQPIPRSTTAAAGSTKGSTPEDSTGAATPAASPEPTRPIPSAATSVAPSPQVVPSAVPASPARAQPEPESTAAEIAMGLMVAALGAVAVVLVLVLARFGRPPRPPTRVRGPRAGWNT
jgi:hypothetical protein